MNKKTYTFQLFAIVLATNRRNITTMAFSNTMIFSKEGIPFANFQYRPALLPGHVVFFFAVNKG